MSERTTAAEPWRIGSHYKIHVYAGDRPVATFHTAEDATRAVEAVNQRPFPNAPGGNDASPTSSGPALASSIAAEPAEMRTGIDRSPTPPAPSGLVMDLGEHLSHVRSLIADLPSEDGSQTVPVRIDLLMYLAEQAVSRQQDATLSGQQGGAVPAGDLRPGLEEAIEIVKGAHHTTESPDESGIRIQIINDLSARLAEQPAPAGTGDADPVEQPIVDFDFTPDAFITKFREVVDAGKGLVIIIPVQATRDMLAWAERVPAGTGDPHG